ncbi:RAD51 associated protein 1 [Elysia marginata]|uniref:RAD51 associated protein 1 n=1 Tax=Elysia marginata TaxID=1093978 RepID=A0AAV4G9K7_9GAST|nr:RAD51 associated protein 1 [Elysia marginata]
MAERRSSRPKKVMKYSAFEELSDDDFADSTPPPPKKLKVSKSTDKKDSKKTAEVSVGQTVADVYEPESNKKSSRRVPVSDKIYERELQQALEMSLLQSQDSKEKKKTKMDSPSAQVKEKKENRSSEPAEPALKPVPGVVVEEKIELIEDKDQNAGRGISRRCRDKQEKQKVASVKGKRLESDDEYDDDGDEYPSNDEDDSNDSGEEEGSDDDSDFGDTCKPSKKKKTPVKTVKSSVKTEKKGAASKGKTLAPLSSKPKVVSPALSKTSGTYSVPKAAISSTKKTVTAPSRSPSVPASLTSNWKPPAFFSPGSSNPNLPTVKSPTSGLRLGLSRNQRVKSLHPSVRVT